MVDPIRWLADDDYRKEMMAMPFEEYSQLVLESFYDENFKEEMGGMPLEEFYKVARKSEYVSDKRHIMEIFKSDKVYGASVCDALRDAVSARMIDAANAEELVGKLSSLRPDTTKNGNQPNADEIDLFEQQVDSVIDLMKALGDTERFADGNIRHALYSEMFPTGEDPGVGVGPGSGMYPWFAENMIDKVDSTVELAKSTRCLTLE